MPKFTPFSLILLLSLFFLIPALQSKPVFDRMEVVRVLEREADSLKITKIIPMKSEDRAFAPNYWKVYYLQGKIVAEELYEQTRLVYYYIYYHEKEKIYQKGFFWHGIYYDIKTFKAHEKLIKQGYIYKNYPETYRVYDASTQKRIYAHNYQDFES